jgi:hypothetical protein
MPVSAIKRTWHRDLVAHPETHAWVLSLYRAGELHPQTVDDYFPSWAADSDDLRAKMARHAADEVRHVKMYDRAIAMLETPRTDFEGLDVFNVAIRTETGVDFRVGESSAERDRSREKLAHFLAHAHFLERRIARSLEYHLEACERAGRSDVARVVSSVHADEVRHTSYTLDAVKSLLPRKTAEDVIAVHRRGEARANLSFSARQVRSFLRTFSRHASISHALVYRISATMMEAARDATCW